jgi:hypothetical protein
MKTLFILAIAAALALLAAPAHSASEAEKIRIGREVVTRVACDILASQPDKVNPSITWKAISEDISTCISTKGGAKTLQDVKDLQRSVEQIYIVIGRGVEKSPAATAFFKGEDVKDVQMTLGVYETLLKNLRKEAEAAERVTK